MNEETEVESTTCQFTLVGSGDANLNLSDYRYCF